MKILVVDGSVDERQRVVETLRELPGVSLHGAVANLNQAVRSLEDGLPDIVVTAADLVDGDCLDVIGAVRHRVPTAAVVVFAAVDVPAQHRQCLAAGGAGYLAHSAGLPALQRVVAEVGAGRPRPRRPSDGDRFGLLGRLAAGVTHDLNNYLGVTDASLAILERQLGDGPHSVDVELARRALDHAVRLTRSMVDYARGATPPAGKVDLGSIVRHTMALFARTIPSGVEVTIDADRDVPQVRGVVAELEQLVLNLVLNACDAMPHGGELQVAVRKAAVGTVTLEVADTGGGLAAAACAAAGTTSPSHKPGRYGSGLGLGIVRSVCARHGALLLVATRDGGGTAVTVTLASYEAV